MKRGKEEYIRGKYTHIDLDFFLGGTGQSIPIFDPQFRIQDPDLTGSVDPICIIYII